MKKFLRLVLFGFLSWIVIFGASICLFGLKKENEHTFEILMGMVLTLCAVGFTLLYFRKVCAAFLREGVLLGLAFVTCNIFLICRCSWLGQCGCHWSGISETLASPILAWQSSASASVVRCANPG